MRPDLDIFSVADAERLGRRRIPLGVQQFLDGGTEAALTVRENRRGSGRTRRGQGRWERCVRRRRRTAVEARGLAMTASTTVDTIPAVPGG